MLSAILNQAETNWFTYPVYVETRDKAHIFLTILTPNNKVSFDCPHCRIQTNAPIIK